MKDFVVSDSLKEQLATAETLEDVVKVCAEAGVEVSLEEMKAAEASQSGELHEDDLDNVAGGLITPLIGGACLILYVAWRSARGSRTHSSGSGRHV